MNANRKKDLCEIVSTLNKHQTNVILEVLKNVDISHRLKNVTVQQEFKRVAKEHTGKVKLLLSALAKHPNTMAGLDFMFENKL